MLRTILRPAFAGAVFGGALLLLTNLAEAQTTAGRSSSITKKAAPVSVASTREAAIGTFQLVRLTPKRSVSITTDALVEIERRRHDTDEVFWLLNPYAKVRILPRSVIQAPGFAPLEPIANAY